MIILYSNNFYFLVNNGKNLVSGRLNNFSYTKTQISNSSTYIRQTRGSSLSSPLLFNENDILTHPNPNNGYFMTLNGYLMDK